MNPFQQVLMAKMKNSGSALVRIVERDSTGGTGIAFCCVTLNDDLTYWGGVRRAYDLCRELDRNNEDLPVVVVFTSWDDDPREVFEVPEIVQFTKGFISYMPVLSRLAGQDESPKTQLEMGSGVTFLASIAFPECNSRNQRDVVHIDMPRLSEALARFLSQELDLEDLVKRAGLDMKWVLRAVKFAESRRQGSSRAQVVATPANGTSARIHRVIGDVNDTTKRYPKPLPPPVARWYCYPKDAGHSILCVLKSSVDAGLLDDDSLVPVPVRSVMRKHKVKNGYIIVDMPYDARIGLQVPAGDEEF